MANTREYDDTYPVGTEIEVFNRYSQAWVSGFQIATITNRGYTLRRQLDWAVLPGTFGEGELRAVVNAR